MSTRSRIPRCAAAGLEKRGGSEDHIGAAHATPGTGRRAVIDGAVATVGTANLDYRSLFVNDELNLFSANEPLCAALETQFLEDLAESEEVTARSWSTRPWTRLISESVGWAARRWL